MAELWVHAARAGGPSRRRATVAMAVAVAVLATLLSACVPETPPPPTFGLTTTLGDGEIVLDWRAPDSGGPAAWEVAVDDGVDGWRALTTTPGTSATFDQVAERTAYRFRVRGLDAAGNAGEWSAAVTAYYVVPLLPVVRIETVDRTPIVDRETDIDATMEIDPNGAPFEAYSGTIEIRGRGNSTWFASKKPYRIELDEDSELMGMPIHEDFVLLANALDRSQLRTWTAAQASEATDLAYTPRYRHVEVILNGQYQGVYQLTEDPDKIDPNRIDITKIKKTDVDGEALTGGYLIEVDQRLEENSEPGFRTLHKEVPIVVKEPDPAQPQQMAYIRNYVQAFENSLVSPNFRDPVNGYRRYLDTPSFIDHYLVHELTRNHDYFFSSTFFSKDRGSDKFVFGPIWDFDLSMGTAVRKIDSPPEGWRARDRGNWTPRLFQDDAFVAEVAARWEQLRPVFSSIADELVPLGASLRPAIANDELRWGYSLGATDQPEFLRDWLDARIAWIDGQLLG